MEPVETRGPLRTGAEWPHKADAIGRDLCGVVLCHHSLSMSHVTSIDKAAEISPGHEHMSLVRQQTDTTRRAMRDKPRPLYRQHHSHQVLACSLVDLLACHGVSCRSICSAGWCQNQRVSAVLDGAATTNENLSYTTHNSALLLLFHPFYSILSLQSG